MWAPHLDGSLPCVHPSMRTLPGCFRRMEICPSWLSCDSFFFFLQPLSQPTLEALPGSSEGGEGASLEMPFFSVRWIEGCQSLHSNWSHLRCLREIPWNVWYVGGIFFQFWTMTDLPHHYLPLPVSVRFGRQAGWEVQCDGPNVCHRIEHCPCSSYLKICPPPYRSMGCIPPPLTGDPSCLGAQEQFLLYQQYAPILGSLLKIFWISWLCVSLPHILSLIFFSLFLWVWGEFLEFIRQIDASLKILSPFCSSLWLFFLQFCTFLFPVSLLHLLVITILSHHH